MSQAERRYDRLSVRLSLIISRLLAGETLHVRKLAVEFGVSERTLHRDFRERLIYLDLEYRDGCCRLLTGSHRELREEAAMLFARQSGVETLFPDIDNHLASSLLSGPGESPCLIWQGSAPGTSPDSGVFTRLVSAISEQRKVTLLGNGCRCTELAPYRLVLCEGEWYLTGEHQTLITVFSLADIRAVTLHKDSFTPNMAMRDILARPDFLQALPHFRTIKDVMASSGTK